MILANGIELGLRAEGRWIQLVDPTPFGGDPLDQTGHPGLWKCIRQEGDLVRVFDLPPFACSGGEANGNGSADAEEGGPALAGVRLSSSLSPSMTRWARDTAVGTLPSGWAPPPLDEIRSWFADTALTVRAGTHAVRGELIHEEARLAFVFAEIVRLPAQLPAARLPWVRAILLDATERWRLARFAVSPNQAGGASVHAEIDLSGCPPLFVERLAPISLECLRWTLEWVLPSLNLVVDPGVSSRVLSRRPTPHQRRKSR